MPQPLRELLIIRHAKSDWSNETLPDIERPLAEKGKKQACKMGHWLQNEKLIPEHILVSPATRAQQTLTRLMRHWDPPHPTHQTIAALYNADLDTLITALKQLPSHIYRTAIIGHNPGLEQLLAWLTDNDEHAHLSTCAMSHLILPDDWQTLSPGTAKCIQSASPKTI